MGLRVANVYNVDSKTYLVKLARAPDKALLLIESGIRFHTTEYDWPHADSPSNFAMKVGQRLQNPASSFHTPFHLPCPQLP